MADNKNQHFVPKCLLTPFSSDGEKRAAINLLNISKASVIQRASISGQCSKSYFYGQDLVAERMLQHFEGNFGTIAKQIFTENFIFSESQLEDLREFMYLQYVRTQSAFSRQRQLLEQMNHTIFDGEQDMIEKYRISSLDHIKMTFKTFSETKDHIDDLALCVLKNETKRDFITSDDPAIFTNRYHLQRLRNKSFGLGSSGMMFFLPIGPKFYLVCYDPDVYTIPNKIGNLLKCKKISDIDAVNDLQIMNADKNIYFSDFNQCDFLLDQLEKKKYLRNQYESQITVLGLDSAKDGVKRYKVNSDNTEKKSREELIYFEVSHPQPSAWLSGITIRHSPIVIKTRTGAGIVRPATQLRRKIEIAVGDDKKPMTFMPER